MGRMGWNAICGKRVILCQVRSSTGFGGFPDSKVSTRGSGAMNPGASGGVRRARRGRERAEASAVLVRLVGRAKASSVPLSRPSGFAALRPDKPATLPRGSSGFAALLRDKHAREGQIRGRVRVGRDIPVGAAEVPPSLAAGHPSPAARAHAREGQIRARTRWARMASLPREGGEGGHRSDGCAETQNGRVNCWLTRPPIVLGRSS
jgi:hypothetical protein